MAKNLKLNVKNTQLAEALKLKKLKKKKSEEKEVKKEAPATPAAKVKVKTKPTLSQPEAKTKPKAVEEPKVRRRTSSQERGGGRP